MACDAWTGKLDAYFDGELRPTRHAPCRNICADAPAARRRACAGFNISVRSRSAGQRFTPDPAFRSRIQRSIAARRPSPWRRYWLPAFVTGNCCCAGGRRFVFLLNAQHERGNPAATDKRTGGPARGHRASANPVDVVSTDRHTVKPWFEGKIPFTFNLPELQGSPFTLIGGKVSYASQSPSELIFRVRQHQISVHFSRNGDWKVREGEAPRSALSFEVRAGGAMAFAIL